MRFKGKKKSFHLRRLIVHRHHCDIKADASDCFAQSVGYREDKLDELGVRADIHNRRHEGYFHEVHRMLGTNKQKTCVDALNIITHTHLVNMLLIPV